MPISGIDDVGVVTSKELNVLVDCGNDFVAIRNGKGPAWAEVVLYIHNDESTMLVDRYRQFSYAVRGLSLENKDSLDGLDSNRNANLSSTDSPASSKIYLGHDDGPT
jgi:hypothetical protein